jgi:hypothetical protein
MKLAGSKAMVQFDKYDLSRVVHGDGTITTEAGKWYWINKRGTGSNLPYEGAPIFGPRGTGAAQITLVDGDELYPFDLSRCCKTSADLSAEQGTIDAGDDCDPGATILDGNVAISGSISSLFRYDDVTNEFDDVTDEIVNRFFDIIEDDGLGTATSHTLHQRSDDPIYMAVLLNSGAKAGQIENWLIVPIIIASMSISLGNTDIQNKDMSWNKGEGKAVVYKVPRAA